MATTTSRRAAAGGVELALLLSFAHATNDAFANVLPVFLPSIQARFGVGEALLATLVAVVSISSNVLQAFAGALVDRWGRRRAAALGLIVGSSLMGFLVVAPTLPLLFALVAVGGIGSAVFHPAAASMARSVGTRRGLFMGVFTSGGPLGSALMPVLALWIVRRFGPAWVPWLALVGVAMGLLLLLRAPRQKRSSGARRPRVADPALFLGPVGALAASGILRAIAFISFLNAMPLYLVGVRGFAPDAPAIGVTLALYNAAAAAGVLAAGALEPRVGRRRLVVGSMVASVPLLLLTLLAPAASPLFYLLVALAGMATNAAIPLMVVSAQELAPGAVASASGMLMGFTWGVAGVLYIGFGALQQSVGLVPVLAASFLFPLPAALLAARVLGRAARRAGGSVPADGAGARNRYARRVSDSLETRDVHPHLGSVFALEHDPPLELVLEEVRELGTAPAGGRVPFALLFRGPPDPLLPQATRTLEHPALGRREIFLVPVDRREDGVRYEAVFT